MRNKSTPHLSLQRYQELALSTDQRPGQGLGFPLLGLFGETGSLLSEAKKKHREGASYFGYQASVLEELGDVLWYLAALAGRGQLALADIAGEAVRDCRLAGGTPAKMTFADMQPQLSAAPSEPTAAFESTLLDLAGEVGGLVKEHQEGALSGNQAALRSRLSRIFQLLVEAANKAGASLERAAQGNLDKIFDRWPQKRTYPALFDADYPCEEQLPRELVIQIFERTVAGSNYVFQRCNGLNIGNRLTDNIMTPDDYRFHDVFHYAYAAVLGWSPVTRALLRLKRKSVPRVDEAEDGARAILIEEGIATWIFGQAKHAEFFAGLQARDLSLSLLKSVRQFVSGYEPATCPLWLWEEAILQGYAAFRFLKDKRRGVLRLDLNSRTLAIDEMP